MIKVFIFFFFIRALRRYCDAKSDLNIFILRNIIIIIVAVSCTVTIFIANDASDRTQVCTIDANFEPRNVEQLMIGEHAHERRARRFGYLRTVEEYQGIQTPLLEWRRRFFSAPSGFGLESYELKWIT